MLPRLLLFVVTAIAAGSSSAAFWADESRAVQPPQATLLDSLRTAHGTVPSPISVQYGGTYVLEGHLRKPNETATFAVLLTLSIRGDAVVWDSRMGPPDVPPASLTDRDIGAVVAAGVFAKRGETWRPHSPEAGAGYAHTLGAMSPVMVLAQAIDAVQDPGNPTQVTLTMQRGERAVATLDPSTRTIVRVEWPRAHPRLGDVSDVIQYSGFEGRSGVLLPKEVTASAHEDGASYSLRVTLLPGPTAADAVAIDQASALAPATPPGFEIRTEQLGPGLWSFVHTLADSRCLVLEMADGLLAFEAPVSSDVAQQLVDAIRAKFPDKPLKGIAVGHYHPHYTGGVRAFVAAGCDVYCTPELEPFLRTALARPFTRTPDRLQQAPRQPEFHIVRKRLDVGDSANSVFMIDIGLRSQHTDEYTVYYFPKSRVLFQGDLGYVAPKGTLRTFPRGSGLDGALQPYALDIATLVQSWPASDTPPLDWSTFVKAVEKQARP